MNRQVNVSSIAALRRFQAALREYSRGRCRTCWRNLQLEMPADGRLGPTGPDGVLARAGPIGGRGT